MSTVTLRPVATVDLCARYARDMGENKVRHYVLPLSLALVKKFTGQDTQYLIRDFIKRTESVSDVHFDEAEDYSTFFDLEETQIKEIRGGYTVTDVSRLILSKDQDIGRSLMKVKVKSTLHVWSYYKNAFYRLYDNFANFFNNKIAPKINQFLYFIQGASYGEFNPFVKQIGQLNEGKYVRRVDPVHFISVAFEAGDSEEAINAFRADLRTLQNKKLIMGNLCMPSVMALANTVGLGKYYVMFCFPIIDHARLGKLAGIKNPLEMPQRDQLSLVGVKYETMEGDVKWLNGKRPEDKYQVESVYITDLDAPDRQQQVLETYKKSVDHINSVASSMKEDLKNVEKIYSDTRHVSLNQIQIDTAVKDKRTGKTLNVRDAFDNPDILNYIKKAKKDE